MGKGTKELINKKIDDYCKEHEEVQNVHERAIELFKSGIVENTMVNANGNVEMPIRIFSPERKPVSWFVGVTMKNKLVGFMQFNTELGLMRYSTFLHQSSTLDDCPLAKVWLDSKTILDLAKKRASLGEELMEPVLSYDKSPTRIAWTVKVKEKGRKVGTIFVAGKYVYKVLGD